MSTSELYPELVLENRPPGLETSKVVTTVFDEILAAINEGRLQPGERLSDALIAEQFGVSRTPVREAFQRLRELGIVEASPSRFTRVALVNPRQTAEAMTVWLALYVALVGEVIPTADPALLEPMRAEHEAFMHHAALGNLEELATANFAFFNLLAATSQNSALQRAITSVVHIVRLGSLHLPERLDFASITEAQKLLLRAVEDCDTAPAYACIELLKLVDVPQLPDES